MQAPLPLRLNVAICRFPYAGNGGYQAEHPDTTDWLLQTVAKAKADPRVNELTINRFADTPITMTRNNAVLWARSVGAHVLIMVDSDQSPDLHKREKWFKPFWDVAFTAIYDHYQRGPLVIGAPYCGPPNGGENVYVFQWENRGVRGDETQMELDQYKRNEASRMSGMSEVAAIATGLIMFDMRAFELIEPQPLCREAVLEKVRLGLMDVRTASRNLSQGWFYYEWKDQYAAEKASTEDVTVTRDIALAGAAKLGYNPVRCAWDSWIGHHKPWNVGKPALYCTEHVADNFRRAVLTDRSALDVLVDFKSDLSDSAFAKHDPYRGYDISGQAVVPAQPDHHTDPQHLQTLKNVVVGISDFLKRPITVAEIGSWKGESAKAMASTGRCNVTCVDTFEGSPSDWTGRLAKREDVLHEFIANTKQEREEGSIQFRASDSVQAAKYYAGREFDLVFIDADHSYESVKADIQAWLPLVKPGGYLLGHDYKTTQFPGVDQAVHELLGEDNVREIGQCDAGSFWLYCKPEAEPCAEQCPAEAELCPNS